MIELDPDLRLATRLTVGRGWSLVPTIVLACMGGFVLVSDIDWTRPLPLWRFMLLPVVLLLLVFAPSRAVARLLNLERGGLLDQTRLCGRAPGRVLAGFFIGCTWPYVALSTALFSGVLAMEWYGRWLPARVALVLAGATAASLAAYGLLPPSLAPDDRFVTPMLLLLSAAAASAADRFLSVPASARPPSIAAVAILIAFVAAVHVARLRLTRPSARTLLEGHLLAPLLRWWPRIGPAELMRQLRSTLASGGTVVTIVAAPVTVLLIAAWLPSQPPVLKDYSLNAVPYLIVIVAAFAVSSTIRTEVESAAIDQVKITSQRAGAIVREWYVGITAPYWTAVLLTTLTIAVVEPAALGWGVWLPAAAVSMPAVAIFEAMNRRRSAAYLALPVLLICVAVTYGAAQDIGIAQVTFQRVYRAAHVTNGREIDRFYAADRAVDGLPGSDLRGRAPAPWRVPLALIIPAWITALALAASSARLRRSDGPAWTAWWAAGGILGLAVALRVFPLVAFPRLLPAALLATASMFAEQRHTPSAPWHRVIVAACAAFLAGLVVAREANIAWAWSLSTGAAAALAVSAGLLVHEISWSNPGASLAARSVVLLWLLRSWWASDIHYDQGYVPTLFSEFPPIPLFEPWVPPAPEAVELLALAVVLAAAAIAHAHRRYTPRDVRHDDL